MESRALGSWCDAVRWCSNNGRAEELEKELNALFDGQNKSGRADATSILATLLRVTVAV